MKRSIKLFGLALVASLALTSVAAGAAHAAVAQFYLSEGGVEPGETVTKTEPFEAHLLAGGTAVLKSTLFGVKLELKSTEASATGSLDNNGPEGMGHATEVKIHFTKVEVAKPKGCTVEDTNTLTPGTITTHALTGTAVTEPSLGVSFVPENAAESFVTLKFVGTACGALNGVESPITGTDFATVTKDVLSSQSESKLELGANEAHFSGEFTVTSTGKTVTEH